MPRCFEEEIFKLILMLTEGVPDSKLFHSKFNLRWICSAKRGGSDLFSKRFC